MEGYEKNLYVGRSDGVVEWWVLDGTAPSATVCHIMEIANTPNSNLSAAERLDTEASIHTVPQTGCIKDHPATQSLKVLCTFW